MDTVFLENCYEFLLLVHLFATFVLIGGMTYILWYEFDHWKIF